MNGWLRKTIEDTVYSVMFEKQYDKILNFEHDVVQINKLVYQTPVSNDAQLAMLGEALKDKEEEIMGSLAEDIVSAVCNVIEENKDDMEDTDWG